MKLPAVNYTDDIVIQSTLNDLIQSRDTIKNFKIVEELYYFQYLSCKTCHVYFSAFDYRDDMQSSNTQKNNIHRAHGIPPVIPKLTGLYSTLAYIR